MTKDLLPLSLAVLSALSLLLAPASWAQDQESSSKSGSQQAEAKEKGGVAQPEQEQEAAGSISVAESSSRGHEESPGGDSWLAPVRELGRARSVSRERSPLHWGPVFISNASAFFLSGQGLRYDQDSAQLSPGVNSAGVFTTNLIYAHERRRSNFFLQYQPQIAVINGDVQSDLTTHAFSLSTGYVLSRRLTFQVTDNYSYSSRRVVSGDFIVDVDSVSGAGLQRSFLDLPNRTISNNLQTLLNYTLSPRDNLQFEAQFNYLNAPYANDLITSYSSGGRITWAHAAAKNQGLGLFYSFEKRIFTSALADTLYNQAGANYWYSVSATLQFHVSGGVSRADDTSGSGSWTVTGELGVLKRFGRSLISATYYRGTSILPIQTNRFVDRIDVAESYALSNRWHLRGGFGHQNSGGTSLETLTGSYATAQARYRVTPWLSWVTTYSHVWQPASASLPKYSHFSTGLVWQAGRESYGSF